MKKSMSLLLTATLFAGALAGCGAPAATTTDMTGAPAASPAAASGAITVVSREDGSGTRGAFIELFGVQEKDASGNKLDLTTEEAVIAGKTDIVLTNIAGDKNAIGYVSLGSLGDTVHALKIDGAEASAENVKSGSYPIARPFNVATKGEPTGLAKDFLAFVMAKEGQQIIANSYIAVNDAAAAFTTDGSAGTLTVGGSSSVAPIMEKLIEGYAAANPAAKIELQSSDSTAGMTGTMDGTFDIGMASRELKDEEAATLTPLVIAQDGIAVIVNRENPCTDMTREQVKSIFVGEVTDWADLG